MSHGKHVPFTGLPDLTSEQMLAAARAFRNRVATRRTIRQYSEQPG